MDKSRALSIVNKFYPKVTRVVDAVRPIIVKVEKHDGKASGRKQHRACAMAQACKRSLHLDGAIVSISRAYLIRGTTATRYIVAQSIAREITSFDRGSGFVAGSYQLDSVDPEHKQGRKIKGGGKHTGTRPKARHLTTGIRSMIA